MMTGGCLCGAVRYRIAGEQIMGFHCHCRNCQKSTGAGHLSIMAVPASSFSVTGEVKQFTADGEPGFRAPRHFCPTCGSHLYGTPETLPDMVTVYVGTLDDPSVFKPETVIFARSRYHWDVSEDGLPAFETLPPMAAESSSH